MAPILVTARIVCSSKEARKTVLDAFHKIIEFTQPNEPEVLRYVATLPVDDTTGTVLYMIEEYTNQAASDAHLATPPVQDLIHLFTTTSVLAQPPEVHTSIVTSSKPCSPPPAISSKPAIVLSNYAYKPGTVANALKGWDEVVGYVSKEEHWTRGFTVGGEKGKDGVRTVETYEGWEFWEKVHLEIKKATAHCDLNDDPSDSKPLSQTSNLKSQLSNYHSKHSTMAQLLDNLVTGPLPEPGAGGEMRLYYKTRKGVSRNGKSGSWVYEVDRNVLVSTSRLFLKQFREDIKEMEITWPESCSVAVYFDWFYTRVVKRITDADRSKYQGAMANNILQWPRHSLKQYAPLVKDIHLLISLWILGEFVEDATFCDTVIDFLHQIIDESNDHSDDYNDAAEEEFRLSKLRRSARLNPPKTAEKSAKTGKSTAKSQAGSSNSKSAVNKFIVLVDNAGAEDSDEEEEPTYVPRYPEEFVTELNAARRCTLLVSQLPKNIQGRYNQERIFLPLPPYYPGLVEAPPAMSLEEMSLLERDRFIRFVYGKGQAVFRSTHVVVNEDLVNSNGDTSEFAGLEIKQPKLSCIYHEHVGDDSCYRLGHRFHMCKPTPYP
ncbi:hypothetical protein GRF29_44g553722 [Pseudopithomyces chartarum]|uniref:ABM domain-containing protein n=1 Tax=Pseudopithomyces chartarum TaxID=1892770 RepID=A0AAN6RGX4_9PLEO|nr:hypothetical protein GRF29_44g553722 [Pseudopithomyces chartarum]